MRQAHTVEQIRSAEAALMATLPAGTLMQRAATGLAYAVIDYLDGAYGKHVLLLVGSGDNGGDALYAGTFLARRGARVTAWLMAPRAHEAGVAALRAAGGRVERLEEARSSTATDVVIDGIVGIGGQPGLRPEAAAVLEALAGVPVVAVDVPSGVGVDTAELDGPHVSAELTVTFGTHKLCHLADPAAAACGAVQLVDIGLGPWLPAPAAQTLQAADVAALLPVPAPDGHKYTRGVVGVRAGSTTYPGAALLATAGAACGLIGMVRYVGAAAETVKAQFPEVVGPGRVQAWVVGPGGGDDADQQLREALADDVPVVVDASALPYVASAAGRGGVLTPHAGELASLLGVEREEVEATPLAHARRAAQEFESVVLLKGRRTVVARPDGATRINTTGTPWLATAGAGDVLAGLVGALLAAGLDPFDAASAGAWLHGAAATLASAHGPIVARDVAHAVPAVIRSL